MTSDYDLVREALKNFGLVRPKDHVFDNTVEADLHYIALALAPILQKAREQGWDDANSFPTSDNPYRRKE